MSLRNCGWLWGVGLLVIGCRTQPSLRFLAALPGANTLDAVAYPNFLADAATAERYRQQGLSYRNAGDLERAIATFKIAAALDPFNANSHIILGWTQHLAGQPGQAIQALNRALEQDPDQVQALNALGIVYLVDSQLAAAVDTHQRAIALKPDNEIAHYNLSLAYERLDQLGPALAHAQTATELEPQNPHPWVALALIHAASGEPDAAQSAYRAALRLDGRYRNQSHLEHLERAGFSREQIDEVAVLRQQIFP